MKINAILAGIAMSLLLLTLPATASDYTLGIFGNANEDETINMQDVTYTELVILEYKNQTQLADGKHDDSINMQDVTQIELIILGKEKEITFLDTTGRVTTLDYPVERMVVLCAEAGAVITALDADDRVVGAVKQALNLPETREAFEDVPSLGTIMEPSIESTIEVNPQIVLAFGACPGARGVAMKFADDLEYYDIPVAFFSFLPDMDTIRSDTMTLGWLLGEQEKAEGYAQFFEDQYNMIEERTRDLEEEEKKRIYMENLNYRVAYYMNQMVTIAGGSDIAADVVKPDRHVEVAPEWVVEQDPEIIISRSFRLGHGVTDETIPEGIIGDIKTRPGWSAIDAVKNDEVYLFSLEMGTLRAPIGVIYMSKMFYPEHFEDVDPDDVFRDYLNRFYGIEEIPEGILIYPTS